MKYILTNRKQQETMCNYVNPKTNKRCRFKPDMEWCGYHYPNVVKIKEGGSSRNTSEKNQLSLCEGEIRVAQLDNKSYSKQNIVYEVQRGLNKLSISLTTPLPLKAEDPTLVRTDKGHNDTLSLQSKDKDNLRTSKDLLSLQSKDNNENEVLGLTRISEGNSTEDAANAARIRNTHDEGLDCKSVCSRKNDQCPDNEEDCDEQIFSPYFYRYSSEANKDLRSKSPLFDLPSEDDNDLLKSSSEFNNRFSCTPEDFVYEVSGTQKSLFSDYLALLKNKKDDITRYSANNDMLSLQGKDNTEKTNSVVTDSMVDIDKENIVALVISAKKYVECTKNNLKCLEDIIDKLSSLSKI